MLLERVGPYVCTHTPEYLEQSTTGRIHAHMTDLDSALDSAQNRQSEEERRRREIAGNLEVERSDLLRWISQFYPPDIIRLMGDDRNAAHAQHPLSMVPRTVWFRQSNGCTTHQARQQQRTLDLGARHWGVIVERSEGTARQFEREPIRLTHLAKDRAHLGQWRGHPPHWTTLQGRIPGDRRGDRLTSQNTQHEARACTAILEIQNALRCLQATKTHALNPHLGSIPAERRDVHAQSTQHRGRRLRILSR